MRGRLVVNGPAGRAPSTVDATQEDGARFTADTVVMPARQIAAKQIQHRQISPRRGSRRVPWRNPVSFGQKLYVQAPSRAPRSGVRLQRRQPPDESVSRTTRFGTATRNVAATDAQRAIDQPLVRTSANAGNTTPAHRDSQGPRPTATARPTVIQAAMTSGWSCATARPAGAACSGAGRARVE